jgi:hypothetical protein
MKLRSGAVPRAIAAVYGAVAHRRRSEPPSAEVLFEQHKDALPPRLNVG